MVPVTTVGLETRLQRSEGVLFQDNSDTLVLLNVKDGMYFTLNEVGARVWNLCDGTQTLGTIVAVVCQEYDASPTAIESDVLELVQGLVDEKLLAEAR